MKLKKLISLFVVLVAMLSVFAITSISSSAASNTPSTPKNLTVTTGVKSATLSWDKVSGATGYKVAILNEKGNWETYEITTSTKIKLTLDYVTSYTFSVRAYYKTSSATYHSGYATSVSFVTNPLQVSTVKVSNVSIDSAYLYWSTSKYATGYQVYYAVNGSSSYTRLTSTTNKNITLTGLKADTDYSFKIRAYYRDDDGNVSYGSFSTMIIDITTELGTPDDVTITSVDSNSKVKISWDAVSGADGYQIYTKTIGESKLTRLTSTTSTSYTAEFDETTYFEIRAYYKDSSGNVFGEFTDTYVVAGLVDDFSVTAGCKQVTCSWDAVAGASGYKVAYLNDDGEWVTAGYTTSTSLKITGLDYLGTYTFSIRAYEKTTNPSTLHGGYSDSITVATNPLQVSSVSYSDLEFDGVTLSWSTSKSATGYQIYYATGTSSSYSRLTSTTSTSIVLEDLSKNSTYSFKVRAYYRDADGNVSYGSFSPDIITVKTTLSQVQSVTVKSSSDSDEASTKTVSWSSVPCADGYQVYVNYEGSSTWSLYKTTSSTSFTADFTQNSSISVKVRAYYTLSSGANVYGSYSDTKTFTTGMNSMKGFAVTSTTNTSTSATLTVQWTAVSGVDGYRVYYREKGSSNWSYVTLSGATTSTTTISSLTPGTTYEMTVKAYYKDGSDTLWSGSATYIYPTTASKSTAVSVASSITAYVGESATVSATILPTQSTASYTITPQDYTYTYTSSGKTVTETIEWEDYFYVDGTSIVAKAATVIPYFNNDTNTGASFSFPILITTSDTGKTATTNYTILAQELESISCEGSIWIYGTEDVLTANFISSSSYTNDDVVWKSSDTSVRTITSGGVVKMVGSGLVTFTATTTDGRQTLTYTRYIFASVTADQTYYTNCEVGKSYTIDAHLEPTNTTETLKYISSNTDIATVSDGVVKFISAGTVTITVANTSNSSDYKYVVLTTDDAVILPSMTDSEILTSAYSLTSQIKTSMPGFYRTDYSLTSNFYVSNPSEEYFTADDLESMFTNIIAPSTSFVQTVNLTNYPNASDYDAAQTAYWNSVPISGQQFVMVEGLVASDFENIEIIDDLSSYTYEIVLTLKDESISSLPTIATSTTHGKLFDVLTATDFAGFNTTQENVTVSFENISQYYHDSTVTITVDKTSGTILSIVYDMQTDIVIEDFVINGPSDSLLGSLVGSTKDYLDTDLAFTLNGVSEYVFFSYTA